ncbi:MAG: hypothetical protein IT343_09940 [Candidatus Melainabacteria bacterium]|nr:hypothetical protein [Candidatus Melainabacteria bacterium]
MNHSIDFPISNSPLLLAMNSPVLHEFISYLAQKKNEQEANPDAHLTIELNREFVQRVREAFRQDILDGERRLHLLTNLLAMIMLEGEFELHSNVIGFLPGEDNRQFLIRERINRETLYSVTDIDLGNMMIDNFRYQKDRSWVPLHLAANFVEYIPLSRPITGVNRLTSRVKAEEELSNKVADEIFMLDELVARDKQLRQYSKFVKDIFGIKIVCEDEVTCLAVHETLKNLMVGDINDSMAKRLADSGVPIVEECSHPLLAFIETKDYLTCDPSKMKRTGWRAIKSVVEWNDCLFEIQIQPLGNYYLELDHMAGPSHRSFKFTRDTLRDEVAKRIPLYGLYRELLTMLFKESNVSFESNNVSVVIK